MNLSNMINLSKKEISPPHISEPLKAYLVSLPGYKSDASTEQPESTYDLHGYLQMQFKSIIDIK